MAFKTYGHKRYDCGCVVSLSYGGTRLGYKEECDEMHDLFGAMIMDRRPKTREVSAEWQAKVNAHFGEGN